MMEGWIKTYRELQNHWIWKNDKYLKGWLWFLFRANHTENKILIGTEFIDIKRGEFITSISKICEATGMKAQSTRTFLRLLETDKMINKQTTSKLTKITICNYEYYQGDQQTKNKRTNKPKTSVQQTCNTVVTTDKNEENNNNEKKYKNIPPTIEEIKLRIEERLITSFTAEAFFAHYNSNGWMVGKNKMKDWDSALTTWNTKKYNNENGSGNNKRSIKHTDKLWN